MQPCACALSSISFILWRLQILPILSVYAHRPYKCTSIMARVRGVIAASIRLSSISNVAISGSTSMGVRLFSVIANMVAM